MKATYQEVMEGREEKEMNLRMSFLFLPLLWSLGGQFYAAILSILCSSISITWPLGTLFYLIPPYLTQYLTHPPTSQPAGKIRFTESNGMYIRMAGRHCAEFLITLFHKVTPPLWHITCSLGRTEQWLILSAFPSYGIILSKEQSLAKPYSMTDCLYGREFWMFFQWLFRSRVATSWKYEPAASETGSWKEYWKGVCCC